MAWPIRALLLFFHLFSPGNCLHHIGWESFQTMRFELETVQQTIYKNYLLQQVLDIEQHLSRKFTVLNTIFAKCTPHTEAEAERIALRALELATKVSGKTSWRDGLDKEKADVGDIGLTGGSLGLPKHFWR